MKRTRSYRQQSFRLSPHKREPSPIAIRECRKICALLGIELPGWAK